MKHALLGARCAIQDPEAILRQIREWGQARGAEVLAADAQAVFGRDHLESAVRHAERARAEQTSSTRSIAMETLLYLSGQRQVADAIRVAGLRQGTETIGLVVWPGEDSQELLAALGWARDDAVLESAGKSLDRLGVTEVEKGTIPETTVQDLALERVALLDVAK
jgi:KEOPS complex subunit Cgi121